MSNRQQVEEKESWDEGLWSRGKWGRCPLSLSACFSLSTWKWIKYRTQSASLFLPLCCVFSCLPVKKKNETTFSRFGSLSLSIFSNISHFPFCLLVFCPLGKPVMIVTEYMENGSLDTFLKVSMLYFAANDEGQFAPKEMLWNITGTQSNRLALPDLAWQLACSHLSMPVFSLCPPTQLRPPWFILVWCSCCWCTVMFLSGGDSRPAWNFW